jgi:hypothetical protein
VDSWAYAVAGKIAQSYNGSPTITTPTRHTRLDYIFYDQTATDLVTVLSQIVDNSGLSDHRLMMTTFQTN